MPLGVYATGDELAGAINGLGVVSSDGTGHTVTCSYDLTANALTFGITGAPAGWWIHNTYSTEFLTEIGHDMTQMNKAAPTSSGLVSCLAATWSPTPSPTLCEVVVDGSSSTIHWGKVSDAYAPRTWRRTVRHIFSLSCNHARRSRLRG